MSNERGPGGRGRGFVKGAGAKDAKKTVKRLISYITGKNKVLLFIVFICILLSAAANVAGSLFLETLINDYIEPLLGEANPVFTGLLRAIIFMGCIYLVGIIANYTYNRIMIYISQGVLKRVRDDMFEHMQTLPVKYFDTHSHGDVMSYYTNDTDTLRQMISQSIPQTVNSLVTIVTVFIAMVIKSWLLTLFVVVFVALMMLIAGALGSKSGKYFVKQQRSIGNLNGYIEEMIHGQKVVKVFCHEDKSNEGFDDRNQEYYKNSVTANRLAIVFMPIMANLGHLQYVLIAMLGSLLIINGVGSLNVGVLVAFLQLSRSFTNPVTQISQQLNMVVMALAGAERIFELLDEPSEVDNGYVTLVNAKYDENGELVECEERTGMWAWKHPHGDGTLTYTKLSGDVRLTEVDFGYTDEKLVLHDVSVYAEPGQKVAFVGATGAGKTTITNLINRFYDIADGKIRYDGININKIKKSDLRRSLGVVLQDVHLFTGTVMDNIRYGRLDATDEECIAAAKIANADGFINMLPEGYNTMLTEGGANLSQGQRQLLSIARVAVADPPVMILDEATSSIDTRTEAIVQGGMDALMKGRTVFVIAHRLSTVQTSDVIMELIEEKGKYYQLYTGAFELE